MGHAFIIAAEFVLAAGAVTLLYLKGFSFLASIEITHKK